MTGTVPFVGRPLAECSQLMTSGDSSFGFFPRTVEHVNTLTYMSQRLCTELNNNKKSGRRQKETKKGREKKKMKEEEAAEEE